MLKKATEHFEKLVTLPELRVEEVGTSHTNIYVLLL